MVSRGFLRLVGRAYVILYMLVTFALCVVLTILFWGASYIFYEDHSARNVRYHFYFSSIFDRLLYPIPVCAFYRPELRLLDVISGVKMDIRLGDILVLYTIGLQTIRASVSVVLPNFLYWP